MPQRVAANAKDQPITCKFTGLSPNTTYRYLVYARDSSGIDDSYIQTFTTKPVGARRAKGVPPAHVARSGSTVLVKKGQKTNKGRSITVDLKRLGKTKKGAARLVLGQKGEYRLETDGRPFNIRVTFAAPGGRGFDSWQVTHHYSRKTSPKVHRAKGGPVLRPKDLGGNAKGWKRAKVSVNLCPELDGGESVDYRRGKGPNRVRIHEDAMRYDTIKHAKQGYRKAVKCTKTAFGKNVRNPKIGGQSRMWSNSGGRERGTVARIGKRVVVIEVASQIQPYRSMGYSKTLAKKAIARLK